MYIYPKKTIFSSLNPTKIFSSLENSGQFSVKIETNRFTVQEKEFFSNKVLTPVIIGIVDVQKDNTMIDVVFELQRRDKIGFGIFIIFVFLASLLLGFVSSDVILTMTLICFGLVLYAVFAALYVCKCSRAFKKIRLLLEAAN